MERPEPPVCCSVCREMILILTTSLCSLAARVSVTEADPEEHRLETFWHLKRSTVTSKSRLHSSNLLALIIVRNKASNFISYKQTLLLLLHNFITSSLRDISVLLSHCWAEVCTLQSAILASNVYLSTCAAPWVWALMQPAANPQNQHQNSTLRIRRGQLCIGFEMTSHTGPHVDVLACASGV